MGKPEKTIGFSATVLTDAVSKLGVNDFLLQALIAACEEDDSFKNKVIEAVKKLEEK